ncbi:MAG: trypsin-like serine protease, partial [Bacteriovoracaceae bacterium]
MKNLFFLLLLSTYSFSAMANNKMVVGSDDRVQVKKKDKTLAHESIGLIFYQHRNSIYACTGTVIAPKVVLTAAHCIEPFADIYFIPGQVSRIWGQLSKNTKNAVKAKRGHRFPEYTKKNPHNTDLGVIVFEKEFSVAPLPLSTQYTTNERVTISGYPDDKKQGTLWEDSGFLNGVSYTID